MLFLALTFIVTDLVAAPVTTQAAGALRFQKTITLMKNDQVGYGIINSVRSDQVVGLKSSNTSVVSVKRERFLADYTITLKAKKAGTSTVSFKVKRKNGKTYSFTSKVTVYNYTNPLSVCKFGKKTTGNLLIKRPWFSLQQVIPKSESMYRRKEGLQDNCNILQ